MPPDPDIVALAKLVGERLVKRRKSIAVAESCTGGMLGAAFTDVPGSSRYFLGGIIAYSNASKVEMLGVPDAMLKTEGAVSAMTAAAMAERGQKIFRAHIGTPITAWAGPPREKNKPHRL